MLPRRAFIQQSAAALGSSLLLPAFAPRASGARTGDAPPRGFVDLAHPPNTVTVQTATGNVTLGAGPNGRWDGAGVQVRTIPTSGALRVELAASSAHVKRIGMRWNQRLDLVRAILGDAWERGYGDFAWRGMEPDRVMPWYVATWDGGRTHAYGVRTGAAAFCLWFVDPDGISLWADVRSGAAPLELAGRDLAVCDVVCRAGEQGESAFAAIHAFCRQMCASPRSPREPVYGSNDWYYAYGKNSAATVLADADHIVELSPAGTNRPFVVIDDGWQPGRGANRDGTGTWDHANEKFPDLPRVLADITQRGARPGLWIRPLQAAAATPDNWRLARDRNVLDPTVAGVREKVTADVARLRDWGCAMIKHDYSTFDLFGRWGYQMGSALTRDGWTFAEGPVRTTAEVIGELYRTIRSAAGEVTIIGCNTVSHLSAGMFEICRIGDDTSGADWARTRKMGVNTLAFRGVQHGAFYTADADCVGVTNAVPWALNRQWLDLLSRSGTMVFVSLAPDALGADQRRDLRAALARAARPAPLGEPLDWQRTAWPSHWRLMGHDQSFQWGAPEAAP
jgi:alpha-galactosidase